MALATMLARTALRGRRLATVHRAVRQCSSSSDKPQVKEVDIDAIAYGYMASQAMFAALEIGVFDTIAAEAGGATLAVLQEKHDMAQPRMQTLLTALTSHGMLRRSDDGVYTLTAPVASCLVEGAKHYYGDYIRFQVGRQFYKRMTNLGEIMTKGEAPTYSDWFDDADEARVYTLAQHNGSVATAKQLCKRVDFSNVKQLLDVGGGSGAFSIVLAQRNPELESVVLELPKVAETGRKIVALEEESVAKRIEYQAGTALDNWSISPETRDCVLMSYLSGSVPSSLLLPLYQQAYRALRPGGRLVVHDFMVDDTLDGPPGASLWALQHVAVNAEGLGLCPANVTQLMREAGFEQVETSMEMIGGLTKVVIATKAA